MKIELNEAEAELQEKISSELESIKKDLSEGRGSGDIRKKIDAAGGYAHELHRLLKARGIEPKHHAYMIKNRGMRADAPEFYMHIHPIEDLIKFLEDEHANDDPVDNTLGCDFTFCVYSNRWGHEDSYKIQRTIDGWLVSHLAIGGPCNKEGQPFLFSNLQHDSIQYPVGLGTRMAWLWDQARVAGMTKEAVQLALSQLAAWVSATEKAAPDSGIWQSY